MTMERVRSASDASRLRRDVLEAARRAFLPNRA